MQEPTAPLRTGHLKTRLYGVFLTSALFFVLLSAAGCGGGDDNGSNGGGSSAGLPTANASLAQVQQGRYLYTTMGCIDCHSNGVNNPSTPTWLAGYQTGSPNGTFQIGPFTTYAANLTPDATGLGNNTDRQVYNALRWGLDPGATADVKISSPNPGVGNFPATPHYLAPPMPWTSTRHLTDNDLWSLVAYIKHGVKAVHNVVPDSQGPPNFWASSYTSAAVGPDQLPSYPSTSEVYAP